MSNSFEQTSESTVRRIPERGSFDKETVFAILDEGYLCHVAFAVNGKPFVIPTLYARSGESIFLHGSAASRMLRQLDTGAPVSVCVTHVDGFVLARSAFHHSMNYRSVVLFGTARMVTDPVAKLDALKLFTDWMVADRWDELRTTTEKELKATSVLEMHIDQASAKVRTGPPNDDPADVELPIWSGVLPVRRCFSEAVPVVGSQQQIGSFDMRRVARFATKVQQKRRQPDETAQSLTISVD